MMKSSNEIIIEALDTLKLPTMVTKMDIKRQYRTLAKTLHPDKGGSEIEMEKLNRAYELLIKYIDNFRFSFSEEEIHHQFPQDFHDSKFRP